MQRQMKHVWRRVRDAVTGRFVRREEAQRRPESTVTEKVGMTNHGRQSTMLTVTLDNLTTGEHWDEAQVAASGADFRTIQVHKGDSMRLNVSGAKNGARHYFTASENWNWTPLLAYTRAVSRGNDPIPFGFSPVGVANDTAYSDKWPDQPSGIVTCVLDTDENMVNGVEQQFQILVYEAP